MGLARLAIKYRPIVITMVILLLSWGVFSVATMPRREDPEYTVKTAVVTQGASEYRMPRSRLIPSFFTPACVAPATNPAGEVTLPSFINSTLEFSIIAKL